MRETTGEIVAFSDANATWAPDALRQARPLVRRPRRRLRLRPARARPRRPGSNREGVYWRYETWLRAQESALGSVTGGNGSIYAVRRSDYVEVDPRFGHDLSLPYLMVQRGRRAVYEPEALALREADAGDRDRVPAQGADVRALLADRRCAGGCSAACRRVPRRDRLAPPPALRQRPAPPGRCSGRTSRSSRCAQASSTTSLLGAPARLPRRSPRCRRRAAALLRARHLGDGRLALELPAPRRARDLGRGRGDAVNRALDIAGAGTRPARRPARCSGSAALAVKLEDGGPVLYRQTRVGKDGGDFELLKLRTMVVGAETHGRRLRGRPGRLADHARRPAPPPALDRRAAAALERPARRHVPHRPAADARATRSTATTSASATAST